MDLCSTTYCSCIWWIFTRFDRGYASETCPVSCGPPLPPNLRLSSNSPSILPSIGRLRPPKISVALLAIVFEVASGRYEPSLCSLSRTTNPPVRHTTASGSTLCSHCGLPYRLPYNLACSLHLRSLHLRSWTCPFFSHINQHTTPKSADCLPRTPEEYRGNKAIAHILAESEGGGPYIGFALLLRAAVFIHPLARFAPLIRNVTQIRYEKLLQDFTLSKETKGVFWTKI